MSTIKVVGLDPSFRNFGMAKGELNLTDGTFSLTEIALSETAPSAKKKVVRQNSVDLKDARIQHDALMAFVADAQLVFVEIPVGSQSANGMKSYGICVGILSALKKPLIQVTPTEVKMVTGNKTASKAQMIKWATETYPEANWLTKTQKGKTSFIDKNEHIADSIAAIHAGCLTDEFLQAKSLIIK